MPDQKNDILAALAKLDPANDEHWTEQGAPLLAALGLSPAPSRNDVTNVAPLFSRSNPKVPTDAEAEAKKQADLAALDAQPVQAKPKVDLELLEIEVEDVEKKVAEMEAELNAHKRELAKAQAERDRLLELKSKNGMPADKVNQLAIMEVLERSKQERAARGDLARQLREAGIKPGMFQTGTPLDQAMQRRNTRGTQRPNLTARS